MTGFIGCSSGYAAMKQCDALLLLGTDFPYRQFYPEHARIVQVDIRPDTLGNRWELTLGLRGDIRQTLLALEPHIVEKSDSTYLDSARAHYKKALQGLDALAESGP